MPARRSAGYSLDEEYEDAEFGNSYPTNNPRTQHIEENITVKAEPPKQNEIQQAVNKEAQIDLSKILESFDPKVSHVILDEYNTMVERYTEATKQMTMDSYKKLDKQPRSRFEIYKKQIEDAMLDKTKLEGRVSNAENGLKQDDVNNFNGLIIQMQSAYNSALNSGVKYSFDRTSKHIEEDLLTNLNTRNRMSLMEDMHEAMRKSGVNMQFLMDERSQELKGNKEWETEDLEAYKKAQEAQGKMVEQSLKFYRAFGESIDESTADLFGIQNGSDVPLKKFGKSIENFKKRITEEYEALDALFESKGITKEEYDKKRANINRLDADVYANTLSAQHNRQVDSELEKLAGLRRFGFGKTAGRSGIYGQSLDRYEAQVKQLEQANAVLGEKITGLQGIAETDERYKQAQVDIEKYTKAINENKEAINRLSSANGVLAAGLNTVVAGVGRVAQQFGRRLFQQALNEARQFVMQYNASMTEIQAITMKTNDEMQSLRSGVVNKAIGLRASTSEVADVTSALYRQGLSDAEVDSQTDAIVKFATVAQIKTTTATKIITTALRNNLVDSAEEAMDSLVALGDSAATTAEEISKAMQKCAASAKVAGVSYNELNSMITVMTSMTQLSGQQVGTALNTIFSRMRNITMTGYSKEINGETTTLNNVQKALEIAGIKMFKDAGMNEFRSASEILLDVAKKWNSMTDVQKAAVTSTLAQTRSANMFNTLMEGLSEDNGETFAKYLGLSSDSSGITQSKYEIMIESINAKLKELRSTYDGLVQALADDGIITGVISIGTTVLQGLRDLVSVGDGAIGKILGIVAAVGALTAALFAMKAVSGPLSTIVGLLAAGGVIATASVIGGVIGSATPKKATASDLSAESISKLQQYTKSRTSSVSKIEEILGASEQLKTKYANKKSNMLSADEVKELEKNISDLKSVLPGLNSNLDSTAGVLERWSNAVGYASEQVQKMKNATAETAKALADRWVKVNLPDLFQEQIDNLNNSNVGQRLSAATTNSDNLWSRIMVDRYGYDLGSANAANMLGSGASDDLRNLVTFFHRITEDAMRYNNNSEIVGNYQGVVSNLDSIFDFYANDAGFVLPASYYSDASRSAGAAFLDDLSQDSEGTYFSEF